MSTTLVSEFEEEEDFIYISFSRDGRQNWSLPDKIIFHVTNYPSSAKGYQKLIQSCKYFFTKNPIIVVDFLFYSFEKIWKTCFNQKYIDLKQFSAKIWVTDAFNIIGEKYGNKIPNNIASSIIPRLYRVEGRINIWHQIITFNEFLHLASNVIDLKFNETIVKNLDGTFVPVEKFVAKFPNIKSINLGVSPVTQNTVQELLKLPQFSKFDVFEMSKITELFDIETFFTYIKKNTHTKFFLFFDDRISDAFKNRLRAIVEEIVATEDHAYKVPFIDFPGIPNKYSLALCSEED